MKINNAHKKTHPSKLYTFFVVILGLIIVGGLLINDSNQTQAFSTECTGGTITYSGGKTIHTFTTSSTLNCTSSGTVEVLVVGGGGSGWDNSGNATGGGGGGKVTYNSSFSVTAQSYPVTVGAGTPFNSGSVGESSIFSTITSIGGNSGAGVYSGPGGTSGNNFSGGAGYVNNACGGYRAGGGGGGASQVGSNATLGVGGNGGTGLQYSISGTATYYGGGGGGGADATGNWGIGGLGGGGRGGGGATTGISGTPNTGGGGGGSDGTGCVNYGTGKAGGSGIVIVSYVTPPTVTTPTATSITSTGATLGANVTSDGGAANLSVNYLVVGGGGGGSGNNGGGGGGGGVITNLGGTPLAVTATSYTVTIGDGGMGTSSTGTSGTAGLVGNDTTVFGLTAGGGGFGGQYGVSNAGGGRATGGSGGGSTYGGPNPGGAGNGTGGTGGFYSTNGSGGGGGFGNNASTSAPTGANGVINSINGTSLYWAGGGGGTGASPNNGGNGGLGGGGGGGSNATAGTGGGSALNSGANGTSPSTPNSGGNGGANTGGGGGGGGAACNGVSALCTGGNGGSGIVIISYTGAQAATGGTITSSGGNTIHTFTSNGTFTVTPFITRGTCWATTAEPTTNCTAEGGTTTGVFTHARTGLPSNTLIYYRGYATNSAGTAYSTDGSFTTGAGAPTITTPTATSITGSGATLGANVTSDGGATLTARGTCWATTAEPTTNCTAEGGTTTGVFTHARTGLPSNTLIYYRGYATNSAGTVYSTDGSFTVGAGVLTVTGISPTSNRGTLNITAESQQLTVNNTVFTRYFTVENVNRDNCGTGSVTSSAETACTGQSTDILEDPSTQKITVRVTWPQIGGGTGDLKVTSYVVHYPNQTNNFSDWSGSSGTAGPLTQPSSGYLSQSGLDTTTTPGSITLP